MTLPALPEETFKRVLCVVAHPDDMEYGTSAAVARWTARGVEVGYLLLTRGEAGMPNPPEETARLRVAEQRAACDAVGVKHLTVLEHRTASWSTASTCAGTSAGPAARHQADGAVTAQPGGWRWSVSPHTVARCRGLHWRQRSARTASFLAQSPARRPSS